MKTALYIGLEAPNRSDVQVLHIPLIKIVPKELPALAEIHKATHIIVTSKTCVGLAYEHFQQANKQYISVGKATTASLQAIGIQNILTATSECQEGIIELLEALQPKNPLFFWPHSSRSRPILNKYFNEKGYSYIECHLYDTHFIAPVSPVDLKTIDEIHFTSPSCVQSFFHHFGLPPPHTTLHTIGPITKACLDTFLIQASEK